MKRIVGLLRRIIPALLVVAATLTTAAPVSSQVSDSEPNNTCATAQAIGGVTLPFTLNGRLDTPDVDFFEFTATPSTTLQVDLEGAGTGVGTLADPLLGVFDTTCLPITTDDNSGIPPDARAQFVVPPDGVFLVAATSCCDYGFGGTGFSSGSYQLSISALQAIGSISGRVIDATTGLPIPPGPTPFVSVELRRCLNGDCLETVGYTAPDEQGRFRFDPGLFGQILTAGTYQLFVSAGAAYQSAQSAPFDVAEGQNYDAGDIALSPAPIIGSISGRIVDAATGTPLGGTVPPFAFVRLLRCDDPIGCFEVSSQSTDNQGHFSFQFDMFGLPLLAGIYRVTATAEQYRERTTDPFTAGEGENLNLGDIALNAPPLRVSEIRPCGQLPPEGGTCAYSFRITNSQTTTLSGLAWTIIDATPTDPFSPTVRFQPGPPAWYVLQPGQSRVLSFDFDVPGSAPNGTSICVQATVSQGASQFDVVVQKNLFCIIKGYTGFNLVPERQAQVLFRQAQVSPRSLRAARR
jgi:hypothetical protein